MKTKAPLFDLELDGNIVTEIFIGVFIAIILLIIMHGTFYDWLVETLLTYGASLFFLVPIAISIIKRKLPIESIIIASIGAIILIIYAVALKKSPMDITIVLLQTILVLSVFSTIMTFLKEEIEDHTKKWWKSKR